MYDRYIGIEMSKISNIMKRNYKNSRNAESDDDITGKHGWIIGSIAENEGRDIYQKDIETRFVIRRSTVSGILRLMEKNGYIIRESVCHDARLKKLTLTDKARDYLSKTMEKVDEQEKRLRSTLTDEELDSLFSILDKIENNLEEQQE